MIPKQDRQGVRKAMDIEQKYDLNTDFSQIEKMAESAQITARNAASVASGAATAAAKAQSAADGAATELESLGKVVSQNSETIEDVVSRLDELEKASLPDGYTELAYIESSGTQYVDTGFTPDVISKFRFVMDVAFLTFSNSIYGDGNTYVGFYGDNRAAVYAMGGAGLGENLNATFDTDRHVFELDAVNGYGSIDGVVTACSVGSTAFRHPFYLFGWYDGRYNSSRLYSAQLYYDGAMVRDYVPCINPNGAVGLYDLVTATFYGNNGTGTFLKEEVPVGVESFNGREGAVVPQSGDYTAEMVGAMTKMGYVTNFSKDTGYLSAAGWYRFARVNWGGACTLWFNLRNDYYGGGPGSLTAIAVLDGYAPSFSVLNYAHTSSYTPWTKIRIVKEANGYICLDGYYGNGTRNTHIFTGFCMGVSYHITSEGITAVGESVSGETVLLTQNLS